MANVGVILYEDKGDVGNKKPDDLTKCKVVHSGDFVINSMNYAIGSYGVSPYEGICSPVYVILRPNEARVDSEFAARVFECKSFQGHAQSFGNGILAHRCAIGWDILKNLPVALPPLNEQRIIARYLAGALIQIDSAISSQERMIELLKERRSAIITQAVTKGLDPKAKMKDSGVPWLGQVPVHWPLVRIGSQTALRSEKGSDKDFTPLSVTKLGVVPQLETAAKTDDGDNRKIVRKGDFVINGRSDRKGSSGVSATDGSVSLINITIKLGAGFYPRFAHHLFRSYAFQEEFYRWGKGIVADLWSTNYWDLKRIMCAMPTLEEQESIAKFLDAELVVMDAAIKSQGQMIELLKERRSAIITQAVTGQIDVR